jgi:hypothetical protein
MDDVKIPLQESVPQRVSLVLAVVVTSLVFVEILRHWHDFGVLIRFVAVALLINLVVTPLDFIRAQRRGRPLGRNQLLWFAYSSVLLTTILFAMRF